MTSCELTPSDLTFYKKDGLIQAGGFTINSCLMNNNVPLLIGKGGAKKNKNINLVQHDKVSESYDQLAVPAGLLYIHQSIMPSTSGEVPNIEMCETSKPIPDDLFDKLVELAEVKNAHRKYTRSKKSKLSSKHKKTKRV